MLYDLLKEVFLLWEAQENVINMMIYCKAPYIIIMHDVWHNKENLVDKSCMSLQIFENRKKLSLTS